MRIRCGMWLLTTCLLTGRATSVTTAEDRLAPYEFRQIEMGVPFRIVLYAGDESAANNAARAAYARIKQLNGVMSDYDPDSELRRLCRCSGPSRPVKVSPELLEVLSHSLKLSRQTHGAFDVTVGPVVRLWRIARRRKRLPKPAALEAARQRVGFSNVRLDPQAGTIKLLKSGMRIDLGGIAKGYAGDEALRILKRHGISRVLIDGSGDIVVGDPPPGRTGWTIEVAKLRHASTSRVKAASGGRQTTGSSKRPAGSRRPVAEAKSDGKELPIRILLANAAVATSGNAYQFVEIDGTRYSHIIDPKTGLGLTRNSSVTVIAADGVTADGLASAVSVLDVQRGLKLIEMTTGTAALVVQLVDRNLQALTSKRFNTYVVHDE